MLELSSGLPAFLVYVMCKRQTDLAGETKYKNEMNTSAYEIRIFDVKTVGKWRNSGTLTMNEFLSVNPKPVERVNAENHEFEHGRITHTYYSTKSGVFNCLICAIANINSNRICGKIRELISFNFYLFHF